MEFRELVKKRRMVRQFQPRQVPREVLLSVLEVARHAPSAGFSQGFDFVVLDAPSQVDWFYEVTNHPEFPWEPEELSDRAPCLVLVLANKQAYLERYSRPDKAPYGLQKEEAWAVPYWDVDTGMAAMLVLLAAIEAGLGALFFGLIWGQAKLRETLAVPEACNLIGAIALGYPLETERFDRKVFTARRRPIESMVHFGSW
ncbi:MAG TPA: nitroreductase family protein [Candidatus Dormibacteraeota bacterium]|nr:nitroreductase family protein [Candidatus Dormibacteraeota bacterium]